MSKLGIYIHIPFCKRKCAYCDFVSFADFSCEKAYINKLIDEIKFYGELEYNVVDTVYFGGGTPSALETGALSRVFEAVNKNFSIDNNAEISVEANPDTLTADKLCELKTFANRVSLGVQSLDDRVLKFAGRVHNAEIAKNALSLLSRSGLNVSADVILGLPFDCADGNEKTVRQILDYGVGHLSAYGLKVEKNTPLFDAVKSKEVTLPSEDEVADCYDKTCDIAKEYGLLRYEVSNFAKLGSECRHNLRYWRREPYLGVGLSAHSLIGNVRYFNSSNMNDYLSLTPNSYRKTEECLDENNRLFEEIMLRLRTREGIDVAYLNRTYGIDFLSKYANALKKLESVLDIENGSVKVNEKFFYCLNAIIVEFL